MDHKDIFLEPCIIDDTPQFSTRALKTRSRAPGIRATAAQIVLLNKAYKQSNLLSSEQANTLAEETGLPQRWIFQWFARQRSKGRKIDGNYKHRLKTCDAPTRAPEQGSSVASFSAAFFSGSGSGLGAVAKVAAQEIIKLGYQDGSATPSVSGSTSMEDFQISELPSTPASTSPTSVVVAQENTLIQSSGAGSKKETIDRRSRNVLHLESRLNNPTAQTNSTDSGSLGLLKLKPPRETTYGNLPGDPQSGIPVSDLDAYRQFSSPLAPWSEEHLVSAPSARHMHPLRIGIARRSPTVTPDNATPSSREIKLRHGPSRLSVVNVPMDESDVLLHRKNCPSVPVYSAARLSSCENVAFSDFQMQWYNNNRMMCGPQDTQLTPIVPKFQIAKPALYPNHLVRSAENRLSTAGSFVPVASGHEPDFAINGCIETFSANFADIHQDDAIMYMESTFPEKYSQVIDVHPNTTVTAGRCSSEFTPNHLEALDPSRAPLKHLTGILREYRAEDGTYLSLLGGLQNPARRSKIIGCLSNEELISRDPFVASMGLSLLSRLGVL